MQLKVMQECITIVVFTVIVGLLFQQIPRWNTIVSFLLSWRQLISRSTSASEPRAAVRALLSRKRD
jgi:hypothetical protein